MLKITSIEALDSAAAMATRKRIELTKRTAEMEQELAAVQQRHTKSLLPLAEEIDQIESDIRDYADANRATVFGQDRKSRETPLVVYGFELTPWRVETANKRIKLQDVIDRLNRLGQTQYLRPGKVTLDKELLLSDRIIIGPDRAAQMGIRFIQDDQFFFRPKPETAA